jgi:hypothetical protein
VKLHDKGQYGKATYNATKKVLCSTAEKTSKLPVKNNGKSKALNTQSIFYKVQNPETTLP